MGWNNSHYHWMRRSFLQTKRQVLRVCQTSLLLYLQCMQRAVSSRNKSQRCTNSRKFMVGSLLFLLLWLAVLVKIKFEPIQRDGIWDEVLGKCNQVYHGYYIIAETYWKRCIFEFLRLGAIDSIYVGRLWNISPIYSFKICNFVYHFCH